MARIYKVVGASGSSGGGGGGSKYAASFNNTTDWGSPSGGFYTLEILAAIHEKGTTPLVTVYESASGGYENVVVHILIDVSGNIQLKVTETPNNRFTGRVVIL